jgi:antitoxin FitA
MAQILIRQLDDDLKAKLQQRAREHGHSTEQEVRDILRNAVRSYEKAPAQLGSHIAARFAGIGLEKDITELRGEPVRPARFEQ